MEMEMANELSEEAKYLRDSSPERQSLFKMLDAATLHFTTPAARGSV